MLTSGCNLRGLAQCADGSVDLLVQWLSTWGLLGFRPVTGMPGRFVRYQVPGENHFSGPGHRLIHGAEPLEMVCEAAKVARAAVSLCEALKIEEIYERMKVLRKIISQNDQTSVEFSGVLEAQSTVFGIPVGVHPLPRKPVHYDRLAVSVLGFLTDMNLGGEFQLHWAQNSGNRKRLEVGWKLNSLLGALYLKMGRGLQKALCKHCGAPIDYRRAGAKTCGDRCRKRESRNKRTHKLAATSVKRAPS